MATGTRSIEKLMPPVVTGAVVMIIGLNLAPVTVKGVIGNNFNMWMSLVTVLCMGSIAVFTKGLLQRSITIGWLTYSAYLIYLYSVQCHGLWHTN